MADLVDHPMEDAAQQESKLQVSADELKALELWDRLQELQLEIAIINAQNSGIPDALPELSPEEADAARDELLDIRGQYLLKNKVVESVLSANPILKAVHSGIDASPVERDLLPYIEKRDAVSLQVAAISSAASDVRSQSMNAQTEAAQASRKNVELASEVIRLGAELEQKKFSYDRDDPEVRESIQTAEGELRTSRQRWRVLKGVTAGIVAGSGVDWGRDEKLRELVLDMEGDN